jgi:RimJ/RimL family protein N-acetyltransferase
MTMELIFATERLIIRRIQAADADACHEWMSDPQVARYEYWAPYTLEKTRAEMAELARVTPGTIGVWNLHGACLKETEEIIGCVLIRMNDEVNRQAEIGFHFHPAHWGRGYAREAAAGLIAYGFETMRAHRIHGVADARNAASIRVMERLGMRREACLRENCFVKGEWCDEVVYALLASEWPGAATDRQGK